MGFHVLTAASTKMAVFWAVAPCSLVEVHRHFRGAYCLHHQGHVGHCCHYLLFDCCFQFWLVAPCCSGMDCRRFGAPGCLSYLLLEDGDCQVLRSVGKPHYSMVSSAKTGNETCYKPLSQPEDFCYILLHQIIEWHRMFSEFPLIIV
jgi:hypothetical protein